MSKKVTGQPYTGPFTIDVSALSGKLFDLPPGGASRLRREKKGMDGVIAELQAAAPQLGAAVQAPYAAFTAATGNLTTIRAQRAVVAKLAEVLAESEAKNEHERENAVGMIIDATRSTARRTGDDSLLALIDKTVTYANQTATKGVDTRKKKAAAKKQAAGSTGTSGSGTSGSGTSGSGTGGKTGSGTGG
jgi:hypothetical protein